jgi:hypothetical protein
LGLLPSVLAATRVVITWENADLLTALSQPHQGYPHALAAVEATLTGHTLVWQPFTVTWGSSSPQTGVPTCTPTFAEESSGRFSSAAADRCSAGVVAAIPP